MEDFEKHISAFVDTIIAVAAEYGLSILGAIAILIIGSWIANAVKRAVLRALDRFEKIDNTLKPFLANLVKYLVMAFVLVAVLNQFGVQTASIIAVLGAAGLAIGLALQGTLSNVAAGVPLRPVILSMPVETPGQRWRSAFLPRS